MYVYKEYLKGKGISLECGVIRISFMMMIQIMIQNMAVSK